MRFRRAAHAAALTALAACGATPLAIDPVFVGGRAVAVAGDSLIALTSPGEAEVLVRHRRTGRTRHLGSGLLHSPMHVQWSDGAWYVSDVDNGKPLLVVLESDGTLRRRIPVQDFTETPHQFAILPDGRIILEAPRRSLVALTGDSVTTFAITDPSSKTGLLIAASGGVLHAVPNRYLTLYNGFGHIRWRLDWPWAETAYITDLSADSQGRIHVIAGVPSNGTFIVYTLSPQTGEVVRWSKPELKPTFMVDRLGKIDSDDPERWTGR